VRNLDEHMDHKRPKENILAQRGMTLIISDDITIEDPITKIGMPHNISYMEFFDIDSAKSPVEITFKPDINKVTPELREKQRHFLGLKHNCIRVAELTNEKLRNFLLRYSEVKKENQRDLIYKLDFMNLRHINKSIN
jgi:hypothetical protein